MKKLAFLFIALRLGAADISIQAINVLQGYGNGGRVGIQPSTSAPLFAWDYITPYNIITMPYSYGETEVRGCILTGTSGPTPTCLAGTTTELTLGQHSTLFGTGYSGGENVGAPVVSPDGTHVGMSVEDPTLKDACNAGSLATTPGQGCGNNFWTLNLTAGFPGYFSGLGINWTGSSYIKNGGQGILYGLFSNVAPGYFAVAVRVGPIGVVSGTYTSGIMASGAAGTTCLLTLMGGAIATLALPVSSGESLGFTDPSTSSGYGYLTTTSVGPTTVTAVAPGGTHPATTCSASSPVVSTVLGGGSNAATMNGSVGGEGYYEILLVNYSCSTTNCASGGTLSSVSQTLTAPTITSTCSTMPPCWWYEMSGFFGGTVSATDYTQNTDNGVLVFMANLNGQPAWRPQGYGWNYLEGTTPTVLVPWGASGVLCAWNEHFHISNNGSMMTFASTNGNLAWGASCSTDPGTPPLDLWSTPLWYYKDPGGYAQAATLLEGTGQATRLTYFNQPGSPDSAFLCALTPCTTPLDFSGGSGIYGPYDTYYVLSNAQTVGQSAILDLPAVALRTRVNGTSGVGGTSTIQ